MKKLIAASFVVISLSFNLKAQIIIVPGGENTSYISGPLGITPIYTPKQPVYNYGNYNYNTSYWNSYYERRNRAIKLRNILTNATNYNIKKSPTLFEKYNRDSVYIGFIIISKIIKRNKNIQTEKWHYKDGTLVVETVFKIREGEVLSSKSSLLF